MAAVKGGELGASYPGWDVRESMCETPRPLDQQYASMAPFTSLEIMAVSMTVLRAMISSAAQIPDYTLR